MKNLTEVTINVVDSIMGSGKTSWVINKINQDKNPKYIFVTPLIDEVNRIIKACPNANFKQPEPIHGKKYYDFKRLIQDGENIVTTHALFKFITKATLDGIKAQGYKLVIDEALTCVDLYSDITRNDLLYLFQVKAIYVDKEHRICWNNDDPTHAEYKGRFKEIRQLCENGNLIYFQGTTILWEFPSQFLKAFADVWVLTYLFRGSTMHSFLDAEGIAVNMYSVEGNPRNPNIIPYHETNETEIKQRLRDLVQIYEGKNNDIGNRVSKKNPLSKKWFERQTQETFSKIKNSISNFFRNISDSEGNDRAWTTFKSVKPKLSGKGYAKSFVPNNTKSTNKYMHRTTVAYVQNTFYHPIVKSYFTDRGVYTYEELYSLSEMIQFIWRFQIRQWKPIELYIPSHRMRTLFLTWLKSESVEELFKNINAEFKRKDQRGLNLLEMTT